MPEKPQMHTFDVTVVRLDAEGRRVAFVGSGKDAKDQNETTSRKILAPSADAAKIKVLTKLAQEGQYDPDNPNVEVQIVPFVTAR